MPSLVSLTNIARRYAASEILSGVSLEVRAAEPLALLGPSGSGKSTLLRLIAGLEPPSSGEIRLSGKLASSPGRIVLEPHERGLAMVFQDLALWPNLTAIENVELGLAGAQLDRRTRRERARVVLERCGIAELTKRRPTELSGGQQQRVALARALAVQPRLLLLDEPFSGLDLANRGRLCREIVELCESLDIARLVVAHDPLEALALCSSVAVLEGGRISESGAFEHLLQNPASETLRTFVEQLPISIHGSPRISLSRLRGLES